MYEYFGYNSASHNWRQVFWVYAFQVIYSLSSRYLMRLDNILKYLRFNNKHFHKTRYFINEMLLICDTNQ